MKSTIELWEAFQRPFPVSKHTLFFHLTRHKLLIVLAHPDHLLNLVGYPFTFAAGQTALSGMLRLYARLLSSLRVPPGPYLANPLGDSVP